MRKSAATSTSGRQHIWSKAEVEDISRLIGLTMLLFASGVANLDVISASGPPSWAVATWKSQSAENTEKYYVIGWVQREGEYKFRDGLKIGGAIEVDFNDPVHPRDVINVAYENK